MRVFRLTIFLKQASSVPSIRGCRGISSLFYNKPLKIIGWM